MSSQGSRGEHMYLSGYTEHAYGRLLGAVDGITEDELRWNPVPEMNAAGKILHHAARISLILLLQVVEGTTTGIAAYELGNAVWKDLHIFKKLTVDEAKLLLAVYNQTLLRLRIEPQTDFAERLNMLENTDQHNLTYYDSTYLSAALHLEATLIT